MLIPIPMIPKKFSPEIEHLDKIPPTLLKSMKMSFTHLHPTDIPEIY